MELGYICVHASLSVAHAILSSLTPYKLNLPEVQRDRCLGTAVEVALAIIQGPSAEMSRGVIKRPGGNSRIIVCAGGPCTYGPGSVPHSLNHPNYLHLQKSALKWMDNLGSEAHRRNTVVDILYTLRWDMSCTCSSTAASYKIFWRRFDSS